MDISPSAHSPDVRESRPSFRKPANEASRRNYRRHSPSSSHSRSPSPGGYKRVRSPFSPGQEDGGLKKGRNTDPDSEKGREDDRFRRGPADAGSRGYGYHSRDRHGRAEDYDHNYSRRHSSYHDRSFHNPVHARTDYARYDDRRYSRRSPERSTREWANDENGNRRKENRANERDRARDDRLINARPADRDRYREDELDVRERYKGRDREARHVQERFGGKERSDDSDGEVDRHRHGRRNDSRRDAVDVDGRDRDIDKIDGRERHKFKLDTERMKEKERRRREKDEVKELENDKVEEDRAKIREKSYKGHDEYRRKTNSSPDLRKDYSSSEPESTGEHSRQRSHAQDSKKGGRNKKHSGETPRSKFSNVDSSRGGDAISDHSNEQKRLDDKYSKGSKWGPEAENTDATAASSDPEAAKMAAMKAAALVNINLGGIKSVDEKKKLLWGSKDQQKPAVVASGTNRWETVRFADRDRQDKFHKLMSLSVLSYHLNVGCERRCGRAGWPRDVGWFVHDGKARRAATGFGKAIHGWSTKARWSDRWIGSLVCVLFFSSTVLRKASRSQGLLTKQDFGFIICSFCTTPRMHYVSLAFKILIQKKVHFASFVNKLPTFLVDWSDNWLPK